MNTRISHSTNNTVNCSGDSSSEKHEVDFYELFLDSEVQVYIIEYSLKYATVWKSLFCFWQSRLESVPCDLQLNGYCHVSRKRMYWNNSSDVPNDAVSQAMSRNRFEEILETFSGLRCPPYSIEWSVRKGSDYYRICYRISIQKRRWWWPLVAWSLNVIMNNVWQLLQIHFDKKTLYWISFEKWHCLTLQWQQRRGRTVRRFLLWGPGGNVCASKRCEGHFLQRIPKQRKCAFCHKTVMKLCDKGNVPLYLDCFPSFMQKCDFPLLVPIVLKKDAAKNSTFWNSYVMFFFLAAIGSLWCLILK